MADVKNTGGRDGGIGTSAKFIEHFSEGYPWAHAVWPPLSEEMLGMSTSYWNHCISGHISAHGRRGWRQT